MWRARAHVGAVDSHARREWGESRARIAPDLHAVSCLTAPPRPGPVESLRPSVSLSHCQALSPYESLRSARAIGERDVPNASSRVISDLHARSLPSIQAAFPPARPPPAPSPMIHCDPNMYPRTRTSCEKALVITSRRALSPPSRRATRMNHDSLVRARARGACLAIRCARLDDRQRGSSPGEYAAAKEP